jgi:lysozyme family protein
MSNFASALDYVLGNECNPHNIDEVTSNPNDAGGLTKYGVSLRFIRSLEIEKLHSYGIYSTEVDDIINLTMEQAINIYKGEFWDSAQFQYILNQDNCNYIFDMAVNMGLAPAIKCAQRSCWSVMKKRAIIEDDGILGDQTIAVINTCGIYLLPAMRSERAGYYKLLVEHNPSQASNLQGWLNRTYGA